MSDAWHKGLLAQIDRLQVAVEKLSKWNGIEIVDLIDEGYLQDGDMD